MPNTTAYSFGDVVLVPFPFTDQTASKKRPAVVVSTEAYQQQRPDVIVMAVTSQILRPAGALGEVLISDWQGAGLPKASLIKPVLATIEQRLILRKLGALQSDDAQALRLALRQILGLAVGADPAPDSTTTPDST
jgi:mRNA interferase MazF